MGVASSPHPKFWIRLHRLGFSSYREYLASPHWKATRQAYRDSDRPQDCYCCGEVETQLHHTTYERLGSELLSDLTPLCRRCHNLVHVLERRGDLNLDLQGLLDARRAARYAPEKAKRAEDAKAEFVATHKRPSKVLVDSLCVRMKLADKRLKPDSLELADELASIREGIGQLEAMVRAS